MTEAEARAALADHRYRAAVLEDARTAQALGATGVPFFVVDRTFAISGAHPPEALGRILDKAWRAANPPALVLADRGDAPGCDGDACDV